MVFLVGNHPWDQTRWRRSLMGDLSRQELPVTIIYITEAGVEITWESWPQGQMVGLKKYRQRKLRRKEKNSTLCSWLFMADILAHFDFTLPQAIYDLHLWLMITLCNLTACPCLERSEALALDTGAVATRWRVWGLQDNRRWCSACTECSYTSPSANNLTDKWTFFNNIMIAEFENYNLQLFLNFVVN